MPRTGRVRIHSLMSVSVLVVDDELDIREAVSEVLADEGFEVVSASDGADALKKARDMHPSVVLLDLMMPHMNGWEFFAARRRDPELSAIPVIVLSALGEVSGLDAAGYIEKPFDVCQLVSVVRRYAPLPA